MSLAGPALLAKLSEHHREEQRDGVQRQGGEPACQPIARVCCRVALRARLSPQLRRVPLEYRQSLYEARKPIGFVYFIETGVCSVVNTMANGQAIEVGTIGSEGMVDLPLHVRRR